MGKNKKFKKKVEKKKSKEFSHENPFKIVKKSLDKIVIEKKNEKKEVTKEKSEEIVFESMNSAFSDIKPLKGEKKIPSPKSNNDKIKVIPNEDDEVLLKLQDIIDGSGNFDIEALDEYVVGFSNGVDRRIVNRLKKGEFSYQAHLDLHGYIWQDAKEEILNFVNRAIMNDQRCILIVHGRGLHSSLPVPPLKKGLISLISRGSLRKKVLAFCTARSVDGGPGSMYILLRKKNKVKP
jgi:DNA-nicking Smr family endonuclease